MWEDAEMLPRQHGFARKIDHERSDMFEDRWPPRQHAGLVLKSALGAAPVATNRAMARRSRGAAISMRRLCIAA